MFVYFDNGLFGSLRVWYFGECLFVEDNSIILDVSIVFNLWVGYKMNNWVL